MAKQKSKQAAKKRFTFTATGKVIHRTIGQAHFNARSKAKASRAKHHDRLVDKTDLGRIQLLLPNK